MFENLISRKTVLILALCAVAVGLFAQATYSSELMRDALKGNAEAQYSLGWSYYHGEGVLRDLREAVRWYALAADQGHADAQCIWAGVITEARVLPKTKPKQPDGGVSQPEGKRFRAV